MCVCAGVWYVMNVCRLRLPTPHLVKHADYALSTIIHAKSNIYTQIDKQKDVVEQCGAVAVIFFGS